MSIKLIDLHFMGRAESVAVFLMETPEGPILFETGPHSCLPKLEEGLANLGYKASDIKHVFLTHIHLDHAGAAWYFAEQGATIYVHAKGEKHLVDPSKLIHSATKIYGGQMDLLWGQIKPIPASQLVIADHQESFTIYGQTIRALFSPGHAVHHIAWHTPYGVVCGDVAGIRMKGGPAFPPCPPPDINFEHWRESLDILIAESPEVLYISHFGIFDDAIKHLKDLKSEIDVWEEFTYGLFQQNSDPTKSVFAFGDWLEKRVSQLVSSEEVIEKYSVANPPWISILGIFRYYAKRG